MTGHGVVFFGRAPHQRFDITYDIVDATKDGTYDGHPDGSHVHVPGPKHFWVDGVEVSEREFYRLLDEPRAGLDEAKT